MSEKPSFDTDAGFEEAMPQDIDYRKVPVRPIAWLTEARALLGEQYWLFVGITFVGALILSAVPLVLVGPMMCGIYFCYLKRARGEDVEFGLLFKGFDYFVESLIATLIMVAVSLVAMIPILAIMIVAVIGVLASSQGEAPSPAMLMGVIFASEVGLILIFALVSLPFLFAFPLIVDRGLKATPAVKASCRAVFANFSGLIGLALLYMLLNILASCACYIPAILLLPLIFGGYFIAYREIFPTVEEAEAIP